MKKLSILIFILFTSIIANAQAPRFDWARAGNGNNIDLAESITTDPSGNVIIAGDFRSDVLDCGSVSLPNSDTIPSTSNEYDIYLIKYDSAGTILWAKSFGSDSTTEFAKSITTDASGNIILTGSWYGNVCTIDGITIYNWYGTESTFMAKLDPNGNVLWLKNVRGMGNAVPESVTLDASGNIFITGYYDLLAFTIGTGIDTLQSNGSEDMFLVKLDASGNVLWMRGAGGTSEDRGNTVCTDAAGNAIVTGIYTDTIVFGATTLTYSGSGGYSDIFIVKYDASGNVLWAKSGGNQNYNNYPTISADTSGNIIMTGFYNAASITFDAVTLTNPSAPESDIFIVKYDPSGNIIWAKTEGGPGDQTAYDITTDRAGNIYLSAATVVFTTYFDTIAYTSYPGDWYIVVKYDAAGNALWATGCQPYAYPNAEGIAIDLNNNVFLTGIYFGDNVIGNDTLHNYSGDQDIFVAKLNAVYVPPCFAYYTAAYDPGTNMFSLTVAPGTTAVAASYYWDFGDGYTSTLAAPVHTYSFGSVYNVCMTVYDTHGDSCTYCQDIGLDSLGGVIRNPGFSLSVINNGAVTTNVANAAGNSPEILMSPNPTKGAFAITSPEDILELHVVNILGKQVYSLSPSGSMKHVAVDLADEANGVYFVSVKTANHVNTQRICISR